MFNYASGRTAQLHGQEKTCLYRYDQKQERVVHGWSEEDDATCPDQKGKKEKYNADGPTEAI